MFTKFSVGIIVKRQIDSMRVYGKAKVDRIEIFIFFFLPFVSPCLQYALDMKLSSTTAGVIISAAAIFAGLLLNLLVLLYSILQAAQTAASAGNSNENEELLIEYTFYNISFAVLICVILTASSLMVLASNGWWETSAELLVYYFGFQLFISIAQILKRFHALLEYKITKEKSSDVKNAEELWKH